MLRRGLTFLAVLGLAAVHAPGARADLCFRYGSGGGTLVAKGAAVPAPNTCRTLAMFESGGTAGSATGSICTDWSGAIAIYHYSYDGCIGASWRESATYRLQLGDGRPPSRSGACKRASARLAACFGSLSTV